jgi:acyl carrier protein
MVKDEIIKVIYQIIDEINEQSSKVNLLQKLPSTILYGEGGKLDSLGLVHLIVGIEQTLLEKYNKSITIANERALSSRNSPFRTVKSLSDFIYDSLKKNG